MIAPWTDQRHIAASAGMLFHLSNGSYKYRKLYEARHLTLLTLTFYLTCIDKERLTLTEYAVPKAYHKKRPNFNGQDLVLHPTQKP